eukprot:1662153-Rhodomonas_salina.1
MLTRPLQPQMLTLKPYNQAYHEWLPTRDDSLRGDFGEKIYRQRPSFSLAARARASTWRLDVWASEARALVSEFDVEGGGRQVRVREPRDAARARDAPHQPLQR